MDNNLDKGINNIIIEAENHRFNNELIKAKEKYEEALFFLDGEEKIEALFMIADIYAEMKDYREANLKYNEIINLDSFNSGAWYGLAFTNELSGGDIDNSLLYYEKAIELDKNYKEAYYYAATIYGDKENFEKAIEYLKIVINLDSEDFVAYNDLGSIYESLKQYDKAIDYLNKSININSKYYLAYFNLGVVYKALGYYEKAINNYKESAKYSDSRFNYLNMSAIFIEQKEYDKAIDILTEGINKHPHHVLYYNRACSYRKKGNIEKALKDFEKAKELDDVVIKWAKNDPDLKDIVEEK